MAFTTLGAVPANQLNALPMFTAQQAASGGTVGLNFGGGINRYWSPTILGISNVQMGNDGLGGHFFLNTPFLDLTGCRTLVAMVRRSINDGSAGLAIAAAANPSLRYQYRFNAAEVPSNYAPAGLTDPEAALATIGASFQYSASVAAVAQTVIYGWDFGTNQGNGGATATPAITIGTDVRLQLYCSTNNPDNAYPVGVFNVWSLSLWGSS